MSKNIHAQRVLIIDFGSQYTQLIARRVRELGVYCEVFSYDCGEKAISDFAPAGIILSGGPATVTAQTPPTASQIIFEMGCPVLGICYGMQTMVTQLGGVVEPTTAREFGYAKVELSESLLFHAIEDRTGEDGQALLDVWMSHGDHVTQAPQGFSVVAKSQNAPLAAIADETRKFYGVQFHPEVTHTPQGARILSRFVHDICGCDALWTSSNIIEDAVQRVREQVGRDNVILGLSGGVDSAVVAALLHEAIGDQLHCVFVDNGLLRTQEAEQVMTTFAKHFGINVHHVQAQEQFFEAIAGTTDPEEKRKQIGKTFIDVFEQQMLNIPQVKWLAQGTIYPDVIESAASKTSKAAVIKSHHNVGGLPEGMVLSLIEPLRELFKDEVRRIGLELGLPRELLQRHPFPGPGLAVRILGEVTVDDAELLRKVDAIYIEELFKHDLYYKVSQAFAVLLPVNSVAVMGDARKYERVVALRAVETIDFMTAAWARLPYDFLDHVSNRIINEVQGVARVAYDISSKPPATIEWE